MYGNDGISVADALALRNSGGNDSNGWGDNGSWWIIVLILFAAFGGWGNGGFGNRGNDGGGNGGYQNGGQYNPCCMPATMQGMTDAFNFNQLDNGVRSLERGICDGFYSTNQAIMSVNQAIQNCCCNLQGVITNGFNDTNIALMQNGYQNQAGFNALSSQLASCCCELGRGQDALGVQISNSARDIMLENDRNTDRIINYLTQAETDRLRTELQSAQFQLSQNAQTRTLIDSLLPVARPAYLTCSPFASAFGAVNTGCGCC